MKAKQTDRALKAEIIYRAMELIIRGWCKGSLARTCSGRSVDYDSPAATCFCLRGAVMRAIKELAPSTCWSSWSVGVAKSVHWNDAPTRTKDEVIAELGRALWTLREPERIGT